MQREPPQHTLVGEPVEPRDDFSRTPCQPVQQELRELRARPELTPQRLRGEQQRVRALGGDGTRGIDAAAEQRHFTEKPAGALPVYDHGAALALADDAHGAGEQEVKASHRVASHEQPLACGEVDRRTDPRSRLEQHARYLGSQCVERRVRSIG